MKKTYIAPSTVSVVCEMAAPVAASTGFGANPAAFRRLETIPELSIGETESTYGFGSIEHPIWGDAKQGSSMWDD